MPPRGRARSRDPSADDLGSGADAQEEASVGRPLDDRLVPTRCPRPERLRILGLRGFAGSVEPEYWGEHAVQCSQADLDAYCAAAEQLYGLFHTAVDELLGGSFDARFGLSPKLWALAAHTWQHRERHPHLYGRFDLSGVIDGTSAKLIEFNADTATVLAEAARVQAWQNRGRPCWNEIDATLTRRVLDTVPASFTGTALVVTLGYPEDDDNALVLQEAFARAGYEAHVAHLPSVTFAPGEGVFRQLNEDEWLRYDVVIKIVPWDWIDREEPELLDLLDGLIRDDEVVVLNPPYAALMQSKAMLAHLHDRFSEHPHLLPAGLGTPPAGLRDYVLKPLWGCEGSNVRVVREAASAVSSAENGDVGPNMWQAYTQLPTDSAGWVYQAGVYWAGEGCGLAYRRQGGLVIDTGAEFVPHVFG